MSKIVVIKLNHTTFAANDNSSGLISSSLIRLHREGYDLILVPATDSSAVQELPLIIRFNQAILTYDPARPGLAIGMGSSNPYLFEAVSAGKYGQITKVNLEPVLTTLERGYTPVIVPVARATEDFSRRILLLMAEQVAAQLAALVKADTTVFLINNPRVLGKTNRIIKILDQESCQRLIVEDRLSGEMLLTIEAAFKALEGASRVVILNGQQPNELYEAVAQ